MRPSTPHARRAELGAEAYRAARFPWSGQPLTRPALAVSPKASGSTELYASRNGATDVACRRVLGGSAPATLAPIGGATKRGFETHLQLHSAPIYFAVQALGASGQALATSAAIAAPGPVAIYGRSAFVPPGAGMGGLPVGCFTAHPCHVRTSVWAGRTMIARTGSEYLLRTAAGWCTSGSRRAGAGCSSARRDAGCPCR